MKPEILIKQVAAMREKQKEYYATPKDKYEVKQLILRESKALEQNVDRLLQNYKDEEEGQTNLIDQLTNEKGSQDD